VLRAGRLLRGSGVAREDQIEIYHDRIGQTVVSHLSPQAREAVHQRLAFALEVSSVPDPESLAIHYQGAGSRERAAVYAADAAAKAAEALAFDRAARLYKLALELGTVETVSRQKLRVRLGDALANAGRGAEAAHAYLAAAEGRTRPILSNCSGERRAAAAQRARRRRALGPSQGAGSNRDEAAVHARSGPSVVSVRRIQLRLRGLSFRERPRRRFRRTN
jgi:hypothetical protein